MKSLIVALCVSMTLLTTSTGTLAQYREEDKSYRPPRDRGMYGSGPGDIRPRAPKVEKEEVPVTTAMDEQWKLLLGVVVMGLIGYTVWRIVKETNRVSHRKKEPWEIE